MSADVETRGVEGSSPGVPGAFRRRAAWIFGVALALRLVALFVAADAELVKDEIAYAARAEALLDGKGYQGSYQSWVRHDGWRIMDLPQYTGAYQPPGYPTFLAAVMAVSGRSLLAVKLVQCLLSALSCVLLVRIGSAWFGARAGVIAGWIWALYPNAIGYTHLLWSETLFLFLLLALLDVLAGHGVRGLPSLRRCVVGGVVLSAAALTRGTLLYAAPAIAVWLCLVADGRRGLRALAEAPWRAGLARGAVVCATALACIAPWTVRNWFVHDGFVLIDTNAPYNLWRGSGPGAMALRFVEGVPTYRWPFDAIPLHPVGNLNGRELVDSYRRAHPPEPGGEPAMPSDLEVAAYATEVAWRQIRRDPERFARNAVHKFVDMWNPTSFVIRHFEMGAYGNAPEWLRVGVTAAAALAYLALAFFGAFGLVAARADRRAWLVALLLVYFSAISLLAFGLTRFRFPLMALVALLAANELARQRGGSTGDGDASAG